MSNICQIMVLDFVYNAALSLMAAGVLYYNLALFLQSTIAAAAMRLASVGTITDTL